MSLQLCIGKQALAADHASTILAAGAIVMRIIATAMAIAAVIMQTLATTSP